MQDLSDEKEIKTPAYMTQYFYGEAEKVINDMYWAETHDSTNKLNIPDTIAARLEVENKDKDPEYYNHREGVVHVSSLGKCLRGVVHEMLGTEKDVQDSEAMKRKLGVFKAGNLFEDYIVNSLGELMLDRQTEYVYSLGNGVILTGRDDGTIEHEGVKRMLECKSVHSDTFWHRQREGTLVAYQNQMQIQTYLWLRRILPNVFIRKDTGEIIYTNFTKQLLWEYRGSKPDDVLTPIEKPDNSNLNGIFAYVSKDDCTTEQAPVRFNQRIINEMVMPALERIVEAYLAKTPEILPLPPLAIYDKSRGQWKKNWLCTYCDYHCKCAGAGWVLEAQAEVARLNKENTLPNPHAKKSAPVFIGVAQPHTIGVDTSERNDNTVIVVAHNDGENVVIDRVTEITPEKVTEMIDSLTDSIPEEARLESLPLGVPVPENETTLERMLRENKEKSGL